ncbi:hypothetical protein Gohar_018559, partial [Gossypium harknessii]|nr:hypothetical protein [Gossypium harknessii]
SDNYRLSHPVDNCNLEYVAELIDNNKREWKEEITNTFAAVYARRILQIPLAAIPYEDELAWRGEPLQAFSMRSAYKLLQMGIPTPNLNTLQLISGDFYRTLWNLKLLPKVQITRRVIYVSFWVLWTERNKYVHERINKSSKDMAFFIHRYIKELDYLEEKGLAKAIIKETWVPPSRKDIKINFNANFNRDLFRTGSGVVAIDGRGKVIASKATIHENVGSTFATEAHACLERKFRFLKSQHVRRIVNNLADTIATESLKKRKEFYLEGSVPRYAVKALEDDWIREPN